MFVGNGCMILPVIVLLAATNASAEKKNEPGPEFEKNKQRRVARLESQIAVLQKQKTCLSAASNPQDMKNCHKEVRELRQEMREKRRGDPDPGNTSGQEEKQTEKK